MRYKRVLAGVAGLGVIVAGCGAASHIRALQPPSVRSSGKIALPFVATSAKSFQAGIDIDWYHYKDQQVTADAIAARSYLLKLHANAVSISFPFFMSGARSSRVHSTVATPTPAELKTAIGVFTAAGFYVSVRPLLDETSLGHTRVSWKPVNEQAWFASYQRFLKPYALMARQAHVNEFIIGTELNAFDRSPRWDSLDRQVRKWYPGVLACADSWHKLVSKGCGVGTQTVDAYRPTPDTHFLTDWKRWDRTLPARIVQTEVGIAAAKGAWRKPSSVKLPVHKVDQQIQVEWFTAACQAAVSTHLGGIYFWSTGLGAPNLHGPSVAHQTRWTGGRGQLAISQCFASIKTR
jgi:hypothetical protein